MIAIPVVFVSLAFLFVLFKKLDDRFRGMVGAQQHIEERLEYNRRAIASHQRSINHLTRELRDIGADIGWDGDKRKTQAMPRE